MDKLTEREREIANLIMLGLKNKEIAEKLFISVHTVKSIIENIYEKLNINNRVLLAVYATKYNINKDLEHSYVVLED